MIDWAIVSSRRLGCLVALCAIAVAVTLWGAGEARAAVDNKTILEGIAAADDLEFGHAVELLQKGLAESPSQADQITAWATLAQCHIALEDTKQAQADFEALLKIAPNYALERGASPRVRKVFDEAHAAIAMAAPPPSAPGTVGGPPKALPLDIPRDKLPAGKALDGSAYVPGGSVSVLRIFYRTRGEAGAAGPYSSVQSEGHLGRFFITVPGMHVQPPAIEYYAEGLDDAGNVLAVSGSREKPLSIEVAAEKKPLYARPWLWGVVGGVVAAGAVAGIVVGVTSQPGANAPGHVTILPE